MTSFASVKLAQFRTLQPPSTMTLVILVQCMSETNKRGMPDRYIQLPWQMSKHFRHMHAITVTLTPWMLRSLSYTKICLIHLQPNLLVVASAANSRKWIFLLTCSTNLWSHWCTFPWSHSHVWSTKFGRVVVFSLSDYTLIYWLNQQCDYMVNILHGQHKHVST